MHRLEPILLLFCLEIMDVKIGQFVISTSLGKHGGNEEVMMTRVLKELPESSATMGHWILCKHPTQMVVLLHQFFSLSCAQKPLVFQRQKVVATQLEWLMVEPFSITSM
ncbi:MAG: hypothetical protein CMA80_01590 [Euryarchaeota archaeon]|nr:hypothetical protein [Euryarchaeota archaeon]